MKIIEILLQGEHIPDIQLVKIDREKGVEELLVLAAKHRKSEVDVWIAFHKDLRKLVAIKILYLSEFSTMRERVRAEWRFHNEAQIQAKLEHRFIMQPIDLEKKHDRLLLLE